MLAEMRERIYAALPSSVLVVVLDTICIIRRHNYGQHFTVLFGGSEKFGHDEVPWCDRCGRDKVEWRDETYTQRWD